LQKIHREAANERKLRVIQEALAARRGFANLATIGVRKQSVKLRTTTGDVVTDNKEVAELFAVDLAKIYAAPAALQPALASSLPAVPLVVGSVIGLAIYDPAQVFDCTFRAAASRFFAKNRPA
jgi:hypothetical protein